MVAEGLAAREEQAGGLDEDGSARPNGDEDSRILHAQPANESGGENARDAGCDHQRGEGAAIDRGTLHQGAYDLKIFGSPIVCHGFTLNGKVRLSMVVMGEAGAARQRS